MATPPKSDSENCSDSDNVYYNKLNDLIEEIKLNSNSLEALVQLVSEAKAAAQSLTAAPKYLKIVRGKLLNQSDETNSDKKFENVEFFVTLLDSAEGEPKTLLLELLSFLCCADESGYRAIQFRIRLLDIKGDVPKDFLKSSEGAPYGFGDEYLRTLVSQIILARSDPLSNIQLFDVLPIVRVVVPHWMANGNELEAVDLLYEADMMDALPGLVNNDESLILRLGPYLVGLAQYSTNNIECKNLLNLVYTLYIQCGLHFRAFQIALLMDNRALLLKTLSLSSPLVAKQIALVCSRHSLPLHITDEIPNGHQISTLSWGERQSGFYIYLAQELDLLEPKTAEDVCKDSNGVWKSRTSVDSSLDNLGKTLVNCFVNTGFCSDKLFSSDSTWVFKHKEYSSFTATLLSGLIHLWNVDEGLSLLDTYQYADDAYVKGGALAGFGLVCCGVWPESDPISGLVSEYLGSTSQPIRLGSILGLGLAYAGTCREDLLEILVPLLLDPSSHVISGWAAISLGLIFASSASPEASEILITALIERCPHTDSESGPSFTGDLPFFAVALAMVYLSKCEGAGLAIEALQALPQPISVIATVLVESFAFAASGDMLKIQKMLQLAVRQTDASDVDDGSDSDQPATSTTNTTPSVISGAISLAALMGVALISLGEPLQEDMATRLIQQILSCGTPAEKRAVPLALALISLSNPKTFLISLLSRLTRDIDDTVALNAIVALGFIGAGTNNSRIVQLLQQQALNYLRDPAALLCVRFAQAILHLGKGLLTLNPIHSDGMLINRISLAALATLLYLGSDFKTFLSEMPYSVSLLGLAIKPRWLVAVDENLDPRSVPIRVGAAVDTLGLAGDPRRISRFQTYSTPVLIGLGQRAELVSGGALSPVLEGIVIVPSIQA